MAEFWIAVDGVAMGLLGVVVSLWPPKERQFKIASLTAFGVLSIILVALIWIKTADDNAEKARAAELQKETQTVALQIQKEFRNFKTQVSEIEKKKEPDQSIRDDLRKLLGKPPEQWLSVSGLPLTPRNDIPFKGGVTHRLADLLSADGYAGTTVMAELYVANDDGSQTEFRIGTDPNLNIKNSKVVDIGGRYDYRDGADTRMIYIRSAKDGKLNVDFRPR